MTVTVDTYNKDKKAFFNKHDNDWECDTSPMDDYGRYYKVYTFKDNAVWYESMGYEYVKQHIIVKMCEMDIEIKMFRTEYWSTESESKYYYEKF